MITTIIERVIRFRWLVLAAIAVLVALSVYALSFLVGAGAALLIREEPRGRRLEDTMAVGAPTP